MNHTYLQRLAREAFKAITLFGDTQDIEGLRQFAHPALLNEWKKHTSMKKNSPLEGLEIVSVAQASFSVKFTGGNFKEQWTFHLENGRWMVNAIKNAASESQNSPKAA
jgi:hypothetical protein